jgi:hypothetical protein
MAFEEEKGDQGLFYVDDLQEALDKFKSKTQRKRITFLVDSGTARPSLTNPTTQACPSPQGSPQFQE